VEDHGALLGEREQVVVEPVGGEGGTAALGLALVAHADPDVGVEGVGAGGGVARVVGQLGAMSVLLGELVAVGGGDNHFDVGEVAGDRQRAGDVVAVAHVGDAQSGEVAEALAQSEQVRQSLAGMVARRERVYDRDLRPLGQLLDVLVGAGANRDRIDVAGEDARGVAARLAARELQFVAAQDDRRPPQLGDGDLEGDAGAGRGAFEDERDAAAAQGVGPGAVAAAGFQLQRPVEQLFQLEGAQLFCREEVALWQAADTTAVKFTALSWNLFHGRDFPPDPALRTWRSRLLRISERNGTHIQVNRELLSEFAAFLAAAEWDVALLQECPPRYAAPLARACGAEAHRALTSRNSLSPLRQLAARLNPDLIASGEGGSNLTLVRGAFRNEARIVERREIAIHTDPLERRAMALTRIDVDPVGSADIRRLTDSSSSGPTLCVANLHASANRPDLAVEDVLRAAEEADRWAGDTPLLFGGDLNLRPKTSGALFEELRERFGLAAPTGPDAIDHLLVRGLEVVAPPFRWPAERREVQHDGLALRLSDHSPVAATFACDPAG
jgi:endonuclease/exonuclease/phosphatase family metal-dependent hydrolase